VPTPPIGLAIWGLHHQHPRWYWPLFGRLPQLRPVCICDADTDFLRHEAGFFGVDAHSDPAEMLARDDVEAVLVFVRHSEMPEAVARCVEAGKHVLVEKPMGASVAGVERVVAIARATDRVVTTGYYWRYDPMAGRVRQWIADGLLGKVMHLEGRMNAQGPWRYVRDNALWMLEASERGGPMFNLGVHWIDLFHWLTGLEVAAVSGRTSHAGGEPERTIEDNAAALLEYENEAIGLLDISYGLPRAWPLGRDFFIAIRGTLGCVHWTPSLGGEENDAVLVSEHASAGTPEPQRFQEPRPSVPGYCGQMGLDSLGDWARAIRSGGEVGIPVEAGLRAAVVADAVLRSADERRRIVL